MTQQREQTLKKSYYHRDLTVAYQKLISRIDGTRRMRFSMATRLRKEHAWRQNLLLYSNILVIVASIVTMYQYYVEETPIASHLILAASISLSLYSTHMAGAKRLETALMMEQNGNALTAILSDVRLGQMSVRTEEEHLVELRRLTQRYESTIDNVQNHDDLDMMIVYSKSSSYPYLIEVYATTLSKGQQPSSNEIEEKVEKKEGNRNSLKDEFRKHIQRYKIGEGLLKYTMYILTTALTCILIFYPFF